MKKMATKAQAQEKRKRARRPSRKGIKLGPYRPRDPRVPEQWEFGVLRLVSEQFAMPFDQLARFLSCDEEQAARIAKHLTKVGYADYGRFLYHEPYWIWLTRRGNQLSGTDFGVWHVAIGGMERMRAVNEIRLHIERRAPEARWICARTLKSGQGRTGPQLHAVVEIGGERHAILVFLRPKEKRIARPILETHMARYDAVIAFANRLPLGMLERLAAEHHMPKLVIREIPRPPRPSPEVGDEGGETQR
jgi:hypothetical protein